MSTDLSDALLTHNSENQNTNHTTPTEKNSSNNTRTAMTNRTSSEEEAPRDGSGGGLNTLNYLNVGAYLLNFIITYGVGTLGWLGNGNNAVLSEKYQTLITPKAAAFSIWGIIFISQAIFAVAQCLPRFRSLEVVQKGVGYYYASACVFQATWTFAFAYEVIWLSSIFMVLIWASLIAIVYNQYSIQSVSKEGDDDDASRLYDFWLLRFPFAIHCGWITAASALNLNVLVVDIGAHADVQLAVGIVSLAVLHAISVWTTWSLANPNYTIGAVLSWANYWIYKELQSPKDSIVERFGNGDLVSGVSLAARAVAIVILLQILVRVLMWKKVQSFVTGVQVQDESGTVENQNNTGREGDHYDPPQFRGKYVQESPGANSISTTAMDTSDLEGGR